LSQSTKIDVCTDPSQVPDRRTEAPEAEEPPGNRLGGSMLRALVGPVLGAADEPVGVPGPLGAKGKPSTGLL